MTALFNLIATLCWAGWLVCFILMLIQMFQRGHTALAIVCIVLAWFCGIGVLVAYAYGWSKAQEWNLQTLMTWWTTFLVVGILATVLGGSLRFVLRPMRWPLVP